jgi:hypothetical protein
VRTGLIRPTRVLPSGPARWRLEDLDAQLDRVRRGNAPDGASNPGPDSAP